MASAPKVRRIIVLGSRSVGKSSLTIQFAEGRFVDSYYPTIENTINKIIKYNNQEFAAEIMDTAGQDEHSIMNSRHAIGIHGYVLVYSITSRTSFDIVSTIRDKILNYTGTENVPTVLVGNKTDLGDAQRFGRVFVKKNFGGEQESLKAIALSMRVISTEEAQELAAKWGCKFVETSAKNNENINKIFELIIGEVEKSNNPQTDSGNPCIVS
ncbi:small GTPase superfamily [Jimgerdemannia flammicorona]|uniref:Small GTPase superfamily n=1 Tax=Jimgerdemannia flammicorona TaxID=994334 RepID=A0A433DK75_9FUNG|nr:small GTPase superfamily [Jimgerdemannia flammicorona]